MAEPGVVRNPRDAVPVEVTDTQAPVLVAVDRSPEEYRLPLPRLGDEVLMLEQKVEPVRVEDRLSFELLLELVAHDRTLTPLFLVEEQRELGFVELHHTTFGVPLNLPSIGHERVDFGVDVVVGDFDLRPSLDHFEKLSEQIAFGEFLDLRLRPTIATESQFQIECETDVHRELVIWFHDTFLSGNATRPYRHVALYCAHVGLYGSALWLYHSLSL